MRIIALIDDAKVIKRILKNLNVWRRPPGPLSSACSADRAALSAKVTFVMLH
jgi:hypothetical protein